MDWNGETVKVQSDYYKVEGGFLITIGFSEPGTYTLSITETIDETVTGLGKVTVTVLDSDEYADKWQYSVIDKVTTSDMDSFQKMEAVSNYLLSDFKYLKNDGNSHLIKSITDAGLPYFVTKEWDSCTSPDALYKIAEKIGGFDKIHNCYNDYSRRSSEWQSNHYYVEVTIGNETRRYKACPGAHTNVITNITKVNLIKSNLLRKL